MKDSSPVRQTVKGSVGHIRESGVTPLKSDIHPRTSKSASTAPRSKSVSTAPRSKSVKLEDPFVPIAKLERKSTILRTTEEINPPVQGRQSIRLKSNPDILDDPIVFNLSQKKRNIEGVSKIFKLFLAFEAFMTYSFMCAFLLGINDFIAAAAESNMLESVYIIILLARYIPPWLAIFYTYVAENFFSMSKLYVCIVVLYLVIGTANAIQSIPQCHNKILAHAAPYFGGLIFSIEIPRKAIILAQLKYPDQEHRCRWYIFWLYFLTEVGVIASFTAHEYLRYPNYANYTLFIILFIYVSYAVFVYTYYDEIKYDPSKFRIIDKYFAVILRSFVCKAKNTPGERKIRSNPRIEAEAKHASQFYLVLIPIMAHGTLYSVLKRQLFAYREVLAYKTFWKINFSILEEVCVLAGYPTGEFLLFPIARRCHIRKPLQCISMGYFLLGVSYCFSCFFVYFTELQACTLPNPNEGQIRFYNVLSNVTTLETNSVPKVIYMEKESKYLFERIKCKIKECPLTVKIYSDIWNYTQTFTVTSKIGNSQSYIIHENGLKSFQNSDPISCRTEDLHSTRCRMMSPIPNLEGELTAVNEANEITTFVFKSSRDLNVIKLKPGVYNFIFKAKYESSQPVSNYQLLQSTRYAVIIYEEKQLKLWIETIESAANVDIAWLFPVLLSVAIAYTFSLVSIITFVVVECPVRIRGFTLAFFYIVMSNGIGLELWYPDFNAYNFNAVHTMVGCCVISFFLFIYLSIKYQYRSPWVQNL